MKRQPTAIVMIVLCGAAAYAGPFPAETTWTYQGRLEDSNGPITGQVDLEFTLIGVVGGTSASPVIFDGQPGNQAPVTVTDGLFSVELEFDVRELAAEQRYLSIRVRSPHDPADTAPYTALSPNTPVRAAPLALALRGFRTELAEPNSPAWNVIGGYQGNTVTGEGGVVAGGGNQLRTNSVTFNYGVVSGGQGNTAGWEGTVAGGRDNTASGVSSVIGGGSQNVASAVLSTVGGGNFNTASGFLSVVPGGYANTAGGGWSFAGGFGAIVRDTGTTGTTYGDEGSFVWSGDWGTTVISTGPGQFLIEAPGGVGIGTNNPLADVHIREKDLNANTLDPGLSTNTNLLIESETANLTLLGDPAGNSDAFIDLASTDLSGTSATRVDSIWRFLKRSVDASSGRGDLQISKRQYNATSGNLENVVEHTFTDNGRFGIGTFGPTNTTVHIVQPDNAPTTMRLEGGYDGADPSIIFQEDAGSIASVRLNEGNGEALELRTDDTTRVTITQIGDVGIGNDAPTALLHVGEGDEASLRVGAEPHVELHRSLAESRFKLQVGGNNWGNAALMQIGRDDGGMLTTFTGDVGIGTETPTEKLDVNGMIAADGIAFSDGTTLTTVPMLVRLIYIDPGPISASGGTRTEFFPFPGAEVGDMVIVSSPSSLSGCSVANTYSATNSIGIELVNADNSSVDLPPNNWRVMVIKSP